MPELILIFPSEDEISSTQLNQNASFWTINNLLMDTQKSLNEMNWSMKRKMLEITSIVSGVCLVIC